MSGTRALRQTIDQLLDALPLRAKSLLVTVWGDAILPHGGTVWLGSLIRLVEPLGLNERMVRTAVFRLSKEGWLRSEPIGRRSYYSLTESGRRRFEAAHRRIYAPQRTAWDGTWATVLVNRDTLAPDIRDALRKELTWQGFGVIAPNVLAHPSPDLEAARRTIRELGVEDQVVAMDSRADMSGDLDSLRNLVRCCWDLDRLAGDYALFLGRFRPFHQALAGIEAPDPEACFLVRTLLVHDYRRTLLRDPQLPDELLPADWPGRAALGLCENLYRRIAGPAERHLAASLETADGPLPEASPGFFARFGGLRAASDPEETPR